MIFCSAIIPSVGRPTLTRAVESVLTQTINLSEFEVIVVNDSGVPLPEADWQKSERVHIINTSQHERSVARNTGAAIAKGNYLHFLDDDDWLASDAYQHLWDLSQSSDAVWLYGNTQLVDRQSNPTIVLRHGLQGNCFIQAMAGEWIPLQASIIERNIFFKIGGFNPLLTGPEDIDLLRRVLLVGEVAETQNLIANVIMGGEGSSTDYVQHPHESRLAREDILDAPNTFQRMRTSASGSIWFGRMLRVYLTSAVWNLMHRRFSHALSRIFHAILNLIMAGISLLSKDFWLSVLNSYQSFAFERGIQEARKVN
jgi:glycosyltransferase involved in cell wall biosynthesis